MLKAKIPDLENFLNNLDAKAYYIKFEETFSDWLNDANVTPLREALNSFISYWYYNGGNYEIENRNSLDEISRYVKENGFAWTIDAQYSGYAAVHYGSARILIPETYLEYVEQTDYSDVPLSRLRGQEVLAPSPSLADVKKDADGVEHELEQLSKKEKDIQKGTDNELKELKEKIDRLNAEMKQKKELMMQELNEKRAELEQQRKELETKIYMLQTEIYAFRCFTGETVELLKIRDGKPADDETPVVLNQKILYLDEDLGKIMSIYQCSLSDYHLLEEALKYNDKVLNAFCPQEKCISFFRVSRTAETAFNDGNNILQSYKMLHGRKMGFTIRNDEQVYVGWMEDEWEPDRTLSFDENVILRRGTSIETEETGSTPVGERVSRVFAVSILRGILERGEILSLPKGEDILRPSRYVVHNYADAWLEDNRFGDFATLAENLHEYDHEGDTILLLLKLSEDGQNYPNRGRADGEVFRTRDCSVSSGLNKINLIENGDCYVSALKEWSDCAARSNFHINKNEFVNLTFMNSVWLEYYIETKKIGNFGMRYDRYGRETTLDYAYMIRHFNRALQYLRERETEEAELISKYTELPAEWQVKLSHWKIAKKVRKITDYQARRFAKYLESGRYFVVKHLFDDGYESPMPSPHDTYSETKLEHISCFYVRWSGSKGQNHPVYGYDTDYAEKEFNETSTDIEERIPLDRDKIFCIKKDIDMALEAQNVSMKEIAEHFEEPKQTASIWDELKREKCRLLKRLALEFPEVSELTETDENAVAYWIDGHREYKYAETIFPLYYYRFIQDEYFDKVIDIADEILQKRYVSEVSYV